jgi:hypothetical protein
MLCSVSIRLNPFKEKDMIRKLSFAVISIGLLLAAGCAGGAKVQSPQVKESGVKTLVNLHPATNGRLYSANFQDAGFIPLGTDVTVTKVTDKRLYFTVNSTKQKYVYLLHRTLTEPWEQHLSKIFGTNPPDTSSMSAIDQKGIKEGRALVGMTKQGVIYAIGYPPTTTDYMNADTWKYWKNHWATFTVEFKDGKVSATPNY